MKHSRRIYTNRFVRAAALGFLTALVLPALASAQTVVSLEFDDGTSDQIAAQPMLHTAGMNATFFINSGRMGTSGYMSLADIRSLAADGNEIGGHTVNHSDLPALTNDEATREICNDREALLAAGAASPVDPAGFQVTDLAYPFGDTSSPVEADAKACGYNSARTIGGIVYPMGCSSCDLAETIPPVDPYDTQTPNSIQASETLAQIEGLVTQAEPGGAGSANDWVQLVMHHVCAQSASGCDPTYSIDPATLQALITWLRTQTGVSVQTVHQVMGGANQPGVPGPAVPLPPAGNLLQNPSLDNVVTQSNVNGGLPTPVCWALGQDGTVTGGTGSPSTDVHTGPSAETVSVNSITPPGDERLFSAQDLGGCAPEAQAGHSYVFSTWYHSTAPVTLEAYLRSSSGAWGYWADNGGAIPAAGNYTQANWTTPAVPASGVFDPTDNLSCPCTGISVAVSLRQAGTFTADDLSLTDTDVIPPKVTLTAPAANSFVAGGQPVTFTATATDASGIRSVMFTDNGVAIGTSTTPPYTVTWSTSGLTGPQTIAAQATDTAGNMTPATDPTATETVTVDPTAPSSTATAMPAYSNPLTFEVPYTASDNTGGSGVAHVDLYAKPPGASAYSKVGSDVSGSGAGKFSYAGTGDGAYSFYTLATDKVGNVQAVPVDQAESSTTLDSVPPTSTATPPALEDTQTMTVPYTASDNTGGSGLAEVDLWAKAPGASAYSKVASDAGALHSGTFTYHGAGNGSYSFYTRATDVAGNVQRVPANPASTTLDFTAPVSRASSSGFSTTRAINVAYTASDRVTGLAEVDLYAKAPGALTYSKVASDTSGMASGRFAYTASAGDGSYGFYTLASSKAGNVQSAPGTPDTTTLLDSVAPSSRVTAPALQLRSTMKLRYTAGDNLGGSGIAAVNLYAKAPRATSYTLAATSPSASGTFSYQGRRNGAYSFYTLGTDKAGNVQGVPSTRTVTVLDLNAPRALRISTAGTKGRLGKGDIVTFTYSKAIKPSSVLAGWTGASTSVRVSLTGKHRSMLSVWSATGHKLLALADPLALGGAYTKSAKATFAAKMTQHGSAITVTVRSLISGKMSLDAVTAGTLTWTPSAGATDLAGAKASTRPVTARGPAF